ncbi:MAG: GNAT family N-acetyltransferase [Actinomycetales bacterium]
MLEIRPAALAEFSLLTAIETAADALLAASCGISAACMPAAVISAAAKIPATAGPPVAAASAGFAAALHILVAGRPPVGFARLEEVDGQAHLEQLSVLPEHASQDVGRALVCAALAWATESGYTAMTLDTFEAVPFNAPFYASCGFAADPDPGPVLVRRRLQERESGLDALGPRLAMRITLQTGHRE